MTGEKFVRTLPYFRKRSLRRVFDECDDEDAIDFLEQLLQLEPTERTSSTTALKHVYLKKHNKDDSGCIIPEKFDDACDSEDWVECIEKNVDIKN